MITRMATEHKLGPMWEEVVKDAAYRTPLLPSDAIERTSKVYEEDPELGF
jgi:hypothetical protein